MKFNIPSTEIIVRWKCGCETEEEEFLGQIISAERAQELLSLRREFAAQTSCPKCWNWDFSKNGIPIFRITEADGDEIFSPWPFDSYFPYQEIGVKFEGILEETPNSSNPFTNIGVGRLADPMYYSSPKKCRGGEGVIFLSEKIYPLTLIDKDVKSRVRKLMWMLTWGEVCHYAAHREFGHGHDRDGLIHCRIIPASE